MNLASLVILTVGSVSEICDEKGRATMEEVINFLNENKMGNLATVENLEPRVRPWGFMYEEGGKFFFCTANTKDVYKQLRATPFVEFSTTSSKMVWVRLRGEVKFCDDLNSLSEFG